MKGAPGHGDPQDPAGNEVTSFGRYASTHDVSASPAKARPGKGIGRNSPCPCGSGKKYKACCMEKPDRVGRLVLFVLAVIFVAVIAGLIRFLT